MTTEQRVAPAFTDSAKTEEAQVQQTTGQEGDTEKTQEQVDYRAEFEKAQAEIKRLQARAQTAEGRVRAQQRIDDLVADLRDRFDATERRNQALLKALTTGETEKLPEELNRIDSQVRQSKATKDYESAVLSIGESVRAACYDDDGTEILNPETAPELDELRREWARKIQDGASVVDLSQFVDKAHRIARKAQREKEATIRRQQQETKRESQRQAREQNVLDQTLPSSGAAGAPPKLSDAVDPHLTPKEQKEALKKALDAYDRTIRR